jgi:predicted permease
MTKLIWRYIEGRLVRHLPADAVGPVLGDLAEDFARERRDRGAIRAAAWLLAEARSVTYTYGTDRSGRRPVSSWLQDFAQDARLTGRMLQHSPGFAAVALLTLAVGIGIATVMFTVIEGVLLRPLPYANATRLVRVATQQEADRFGNPNFANLDFVDFRTQSRTLELAGRLFDTGTLTAPGEPELLNVSSVSANFFSTLGVRLVTGRDFTSADDRAGAGGVAILSHDVWRRRFGGDQSAIGTTITIDTRTYAVIGVAPAELRVLSGIDIYLPLGQNTLPVLTRRTNRLIQVVGLQRPGVTLEQARAEVAALGGVLAAAYPDTNKQRTYTVNPLRLNVGDLGNTLWLLFAAVIVVLLIACVNIANLLLARALTRQHEIALRVALGAGRGRLIRQCLAESVVIGALGGALGVALAWIGTKPFIEMWPGGLPRVDGIAINGSVLLFALGISVASGIAFGLAPAFGARTRDVESTLRAGGRGIAGRPRRMQGAFVIVQVALAMVLLACASLLGRTLLTVSSRDPGVDVRNVLTARTAISPAKLRNPAEARLAWQDLLDRGRRVPGVSAIAMVDTVPMRQGSNQIEYRLSAAPVPEKQQTTTLATCITPDYLKVTGIPLRAGRFFTDADRPGAQAVVVIDEVLAERAFGQRNPIGAELWSNELGPDPVTIVGVVGHVRQWGLAADDQSAVRAQLYYPFAQLPDQLVWRWSQLMSIAVRTEVDPTTVVTPLRRAVVGESRDQVLYQLNTFQDLADASIASQRFLLLLFSIFATMALALACVGIYGVLANLTRQRLPEMSVRMALGASAGAVRWLVLRHSVGLMMIGVLVGVAGAIATEKTLSSLVEGAEPRGALSVAVAVPVLVLAGLLASFIPARRASRVNPATLLK